LLEGNIANHASHVFAAYLIENEAISLKSALRPQGKSY
jgi:hypothetical protein